ncbi:MAG: copper homeostasis protein CutC [Gemmatimonadetes bacterium]|nr:copper homeostasis protein CutC [Gemmatimonadota bacterium]NNM04232.1 copper homeostasis protein CutC [Gemmatimonadota bacterium]
MVICEVCVEGVMSALTAEAGGADRIELCAGLVDGGITPSLGTIQGVLDRVSIPTVVLVRPRRGDFLYSVEEKDVLIRDIRIARESGAYGIATGALTRDGSVDRPLMRRVRDEAGPSSLTFHRAFDMVADPMQSLEVLIELGVDRVLTSGLERNVPQGMEMIRELAGQAGGRISVMPGGGITADNVGSVVSTTGATEIHFTATTESKSAMAHKNTRPRMGGDRVLGEFELSLTDQEKVRRIREAAAAPEN